MKLSLLILAGGDLALYVVAGVALAFWASLRPAALVGLGVAVILTIALVLAARRSRTAPRPSEASRAHGADVADLDAATSLRNQPTWRDDVEGRVGPKW